MATTVKATSLADGSVATAPASKAALVIAFDWRDSQPKARTAAPMLCDAVWALASLKFAGELEALGVEWDQSMSDAETESAAMALLSRHDVSVESDEAQAVDKKADGRGKALA